MAATAVAALTQTTGLCAHSAIPASSHEGKCSSRTEATGSNRARAAAQDVLANGAHYPDGDRGISSAQPLRAARAKARGRAVLEHGARDLIIGHLASQAGASLGLRCCRTLQRIAPLVR